MSAPVHTAVHVVIAAVFFFVLQHYFIGETLQLSLVWAIAGGIGAGFLAHIQSNRGR
jgi:hypothetical protein